MLPHITSRIKMEETWGETWEKHRRSRGGVRKRRLRAPGLILSHPTRSQGMLAQVVYAAGVFIL